MSIVVNPRKLQSLKVVRFNFVRAPLFGRLRWHCENHEQICVFVTTHDFKGKHYDEYCLLTVLPGLIDWRISKTDAVLRASVICAKNHGRYHLKPVDSTGLPPARWPVENEHLEMVFNPNTRDRSGIFIISGGEYTLFE
jgi:hypothetical protein